ncbi:MAG: hypothetical protein RLZZ65_281 [Bacteroidota bacterium]|jgi:triosephosphate isomerase
MRKKILAANWKMNLTQPEVQLWAQQFENLNWSSDTKEVRVYPSAIYLASLASSMPGVGAQNFHAAPSGAFTGEVSLLQLQSIGVHSVLIGHSERRSIFQENDAIIAEKMQAALQQQMPVILCCGEALSVRETAGHISFVQEQLSSALAGIASEQTPFLTIAYEPIWAIGTGLNANAVQITEMHAAIRSLLLELFGNAGQDIPILYGGSVNAANAQEVFACPEVGGALVGGASLDPAIFYQLWENL